MCEGDTECVTAGGRECLYQAQLFALGFHQYFTQRKSEVLCLPIYQHIEFKSCILVYRT